MRRRSGVGVRHGNLRTNPASGAELPTVSEREMLYLAAEEVARLAGAMPPGYRAAVLLAAWTGMRAGEVWGLKRARLNTLQGTLTVAETLVTVDGQGLMQTTPKSKRPRTIILPKSLCSELDAHLRDFTAGGTGPDALVFTTITGSPVAQTGFLRYVFGRQSVPSYLRTSTDSGSTTYAIRRRV